jgi:hypothetical protein
VERVSVGGLAHLSGMNLRYVSAGIAATGTDPSTGRRERVWAELRDTPDVSRVVAWVLDVAEVRYAAWQRGEPDPFGLPLPDGLCVAGDAVGTSVGSVKMDPATPKGDAPHPAPLGGGATADETDSPGRPREDQ